MKVCREHNYASLDVIGPRCIEERRVALSDADAVQVGGQHYVDMAIQPWEVMQSVLSPEEFRGFLRGNVIKYSMRAGKKEGSDDAAKARHYAKKLAEVSQ